MPMPPVNQCSTSVSTTASQVNTNGANRQPVCRIASQRTFGQLTSRSCWVSPGCVFGCGTRLFSCGGLRFLTFPRGARSILTAAFGCLTLLCVNPITDDMLKSWLQVLL